MSEFDVKIRNNADWYIRKHSMKLEAWRYTRLNDHHNKLVEHLDSGDGELPVVTSYVSEQSWYILSTRRVISFVNGKRGDVPASETETSGYGNFKGYGNQRTERMTLQSQHLPAASLEFETGYASMAPIYYFRFWAIRYPIIDKLYHDPYTKTRSGQPFEKEHP